MRGREVTILTDPYEGADWGYPPVATTANVVTISNDHPHHAGMSGIEGKPRVLRGPGEYEIGGVFITGIPTAKTQAESAKKKKSAVEIPSNTVFVFDYDGLTICHLGDLDHFLTARWILFSVRGGRQRFARACHPPWPLHRARVRVLDDRLVPAAGLPPPPGEPLAHYSPGVEVSIGRPEAHG